MSPAVWSNLLKHIGLQVERFGFEIGVGSNTLSWNVLVFLRQLWLVGGYPGTVLLLM